MFGNFLLFFNWHPLTWLFFFFRKIVLNCVCVLYISPDPRGVISTTHPSKTAPCLQLAWENLRLKPITPLTSTETCEFHWNSFVQFFFFFLFLFFLATSEWPLTLILVFKVLWGRCVLCVPLGFGSWFCWCYSHQKGRGWIQKDQRVLGLHPCGGGAGEDRSRWCSILFVFGLDSHSVKIRSKITSFFFKSIFLSTFWFFFFFVTRVIRRSPAVAPLTTN